MTSVGEAGPMMISGSKPGPTETSDKAGTSSVTLRDSSDRTDRETDHPDDIAPMVLTSATQELFGCRADEDVTVDSGTPYKLLEKSMDIIQDMKHKSLACLSDFSPACEARYCWLFLDYPEDEMLLVFDQDFTYGQSFLPGSDTEAKERICHPEPETLDASENEINKTPKPTQWISLGSEQEIDEESVKETREKLWYKLSRVRRKFGKPVCFSDRNTADAKDGYLECVSYQDSRFSIKQMQRDCGIQAVPRLQSCSAQTQGSVLAAEKNTAQQYLAKWFYQFQIIRLKNFCNSVTPRVLQALKQEEIVNVFCDDWKVLGAGAEAGNWSGKVSKDLVFHQAFGDQKYIKDMKISCINWHPSIHGLVTVALTNKKEEDVSQPPKFTSNPAVIIFYSISDPSVTQLLLECPDDILAFEFCPSNSDIIVGGCINGQVVLWDISAHTKNYQGTRASGSNNFINTGTVDFNNIENKTPVISYCALSASESRHKAPITDVQWLPQTFEVTRTGLPVENKYNVSAQVVTCSPDCTVMFWDVRVPKLLTPSISDTKQDVNQKAGMTPHSIPETFKHLDRTWKPLFRVSLPKINVSGEYYPLKFSLDNYSCEGNTAENTEKTHENNSTEVIPDYSQIRAPSARTLKTREDVNTRFYIITEDGKIVYTDWKLAKDESGQLFSARPLFCFSIHHWFGNTIQRSPYFKDIVLTMGGWNFAIFNEDVMEGPIVMSPRSEQEYTVGCWSLSRPAIFFIGREDGSIEVWNLLENTSMPAHVQAHITNTRITCLKPWTASAKQHFLAVADDLGVLRLFEIPKTFYTPSKNEFGMVQKQLELEKDRLKDCLKRKEFSKLTKQTEELQKKKTLSVIQGNCAFTSQGSCVPGMGGPKSKLSALFFLMIP
ncbi:LOW QUALITY PROTEIN: dynein axonemal intermediate chain 3 [Pholidichthys leucotaenia]